MIGELEMQNSVACFFVYYRGLYNYYLCPFRYFMIDLCNKALLLELGLFVLGNSSTYEI